MSFCSRVLAFQFNILKSTMVLIVESVRQSFIMPSKQITYVKASMLKPKTLKMMLKQAFRQRCCHH